jgi:CBS domain-containing protein
MPKRKLITDVMHNSKLLCLPPQTTVTAAARKMFERKVGAVMVTLGGTLLGIVTERDVNFRVVALGRSPETTRLSDIMTKDPDTLPPDAAVDEALEMMQSYGYRHVPVERDGTVIGVISIRDIFMEVKQDLENDIHEREEFMFGSGYSMAVAAH